MATDTPPILKCGCSGQATRAGQPWCIVHNTGDLPEAQPDLTGRVSQCRYCRKEAKSNAEGSGFKFLPFFEYQPTQPKDVHYCGCYGWD